MIDSLHDVSEGRHGPLPKISSMGAITLTNLRLIFAEYDDVTHNVTVGYKTIIALQVRNKQSKVNHQIKFDTLRVIGSDRTTLGVMSKKEALALANSENLD